MDKNLSNLLTAFEESIRDVPNAPLRDELLRFLMQLAIEIGLIGGAAK